MNGERAFGDRFFPVISHLPATELDFASRGAAPSRTAGSGCRLPAVPVSLSVRSAASSSRRAEDMAVNDVLVDGLGWAEDETIGIVGGNGGARTHTLVPEASP